MKERTINAVLMKQMVSLEASMVANSGQATALEIVAH